MALDQFNAYLQNKIIHFCIDIQKNTNEKIRSMIIILMNFLCHKMSSPLMAITVIIDFPQGRGRGQGNYNYL